MSNQYMYLLSINFWKKKYFELDLLIVEIKEQHEKCQYQVLS